MKKVRSKKKALEGSQDVSLYNPMGAICCHGNLKVCSDLDKNLMQPFPHPNDASDKIWLQLAFWLLRYTCLEVLTHRHTDVPTFIFFLDILHVKKVSNNTTSTQQYPLLLRIKSYFQRL